MSVVSSTTGADELIPDSVENPTSIEDEAAQAFAMGKRDYAMRDFPSTVIHLAKACELFTKMHGELADELGDVYFYYGRALFANARSESTVLGDKIDEDNEEQDDEGEDDEEAEAEEASTTENGESSANGAESEKTSKTDGGETNEAEAEKTPTAESSNSVTDETNGAEAENADTPKTENGEADDFQLAWEILEMAKLIFQRKSDEDKEIAAKLADVYLTLGEIGVESESYETAITDIQTCLSIQKKCLKSDSRRIAQTLYQLGLAFALQEDCDSAVGSFKAAIKQLRKRLDNLDIAQKAGIKIIEGEKHDSFYSIDNEVEDINAVIKELEEKVVDITDYKVHLKNEIVAKLGFGTDGASTSSQAPVVDTEAKPVTNINHLVRKKRKNEDDNETGVEKKPKTDEVSST